MIPEYRMNLLKLAKYKNKDIVELAEEGAKTSINKTAEGIAIQRGLPNV